MEVKTKLLESRKGIFVENDRCGEIKTYAISKNYKGKYDLADSVNHVIEINYSDGEKEQVVIGIDYRKAFYEGSFMSFPQEFRRTYSGKNKIDLEQELGLN